MTRFWSMLAVLLVVLAIQLVSLREAFGASQGGAQIQLAANRPVYFLAPA